MAKILLESGLIIDTNQTTQIEMLKFEIVFSLLNQTKISLRFKKPLDEENYIFPKAIQFVLLRKISKNNVLYEDDLTDLDDLVEHETMDPDFKHLIKQIYYRNERNYNPPYLNRIMNWVNPKMLALTEEIMNEIEIIPFEDKKQIKDICDILLQNSPIRHHCKR